MAWLAGCANVLKAALLLALLSPRCFCCVAPCFEIALGALGVGGRNLAVPAAAFIDYQKNWNASLAARLGPPIVTIPGGVHPNASFGAISLHLEATQGTQEVGMAAALDLMSGETGAKPVIGLIGPAYSSVSMPIATVAAVRQIPQVSCCATSPALSNKDSYPFFLRTVPPDTIQARALWHWIRHFEVPIAACLYSAEGYGQGLFDALKELARVEGQQDRVQGQTLRDMQQEFVAEEARTSVRLLKQIGSRFVVLLVGWRLAAPLLDILDEEEILSPAWQVLASETIRDSIAAKRTVGFMYFLPSGKGAKFPDLQRLWSLLGPQDIYGTDQMRVPVGLLGNELFTEGEASNLGPSEAFGFDAVYTFIIAINQLLAEMDPSAIKGQVLLEQMRRVRFTGASGEVSFNENGDRFGTYELMNIQSDGRAIAIASFSSLTLSFTFHNQPIWMDGGVRSMPPQELYSCDPGFYWEDQSRLCRKCPKGTMCVGGATASLMSCPRGTFASEIGMMNCTPCPKGSFALDAGSVQCTPCPPGTEGPQEGMEICSRCVSGFYMPLGGSSQCIPCGKGQITPETGSTAVSDCLCAEHSFMCEERGCLPCPVGLHCPQGLGPPQQQGGFWADPNASHCDFSVLRCRDDLECPPGPLGGCSDGREGQACNNCQASHYPRGIGACEHCEDGDTLPLILGVMLFLCGLFLISRSHWDPSQVSLNTVTAASVSGQLLMSIQALGSIRELSIQWHEPVKTLINLTKILMFDFHFVRTSCFFGTDSPVLFFVNRLLMCPVACALLVCSWIVNKVRGRPKPFNTVMNQCGLLIFAFFLSITRTTLIPFQCVSNPNGSSSMLAHPGIICYESADHAIFAGLALVGVVTQPVAVLVLASYLIYTYPSHIASGQGLRFSARYRFLFHRFKPEAYYYGLVLLYRNGLVALLPTVLVGVPELQVPLMGIILIAVQNLEVYACPWRTELANLVDMLLTDLLLVILLSAGPLLLTDKTQTEAVLGWLLCVPVLAIMLVALLSFVKFAVKHLRPKEQLYGIFLCHHKAGAGSLCRLIKILIAQHSSTRVFLDSDQLENLDLLFDIVRTSVKNLVVVLTPELLSRSWCAGEIVTAWKNSITTVPLVCDGFEILSDEAQKQIPELWTPHQKAQLSNYGVEIDDLNAAYAWLQHELTPLKMPRFGPVGDREVVVVDLLSLCGLFPSRRPSERASIKVSRPRILILSSLMEAEFLSACEVFQSLLQVQLSVECEVIHGIQQMATCRPFAYYLVVLLFRGIFRDKDFAKLLLHAAYCAPSQRTLEMVPVIADSNFDFPSIDTLMKRSPITAPIPGGLAHAQQVLKGLRTVLALPFAPHSSAGLQQRQVAEIASRMHRYEDSVAAATNDENDDRLVHDSAELIPHWSHSLGEVDSETDGSIAGEMEMVEVAF